MQHSWPSWRNSPLTLQRGSLVFIVCPVLTLLILQRCLISPKDQRKPSQDSSQPKPDESNHRLFTKTVWAVTPNIIVEAKICIFKMCLCVTHPRIVENRKPHTPVLIFASHLIPTHGARIRGCSG